MNHFRSIYKYFLHVVTARHTKGFGVHSPFLFQFTRYVLCEKHPYYFFRQVEDLRSVLKKDNRVLAIEDFGTGKNRTEKVSSILKKSVKSAKYGQLLFRIVNYIEAESVLELGTSLGLTTSYLAGSSTKIRCISMEGSGTLAGVASENLCKLRLGNVEIAVGSIDEMLPEVLTKIGKLDFVFFDANHRCDAVLRYFELCRGKAHDKTVFVFDDIHWSPDMEKAWEAIKACPQVVATIDLFELGIVFFNSDLHNKHYKMRY